MGYGYYFLPDGREAGYLVPAKCDKLYCSHEIDRGLSYLCGSDPNGRRDPEHYGCGNYYCETHEYDHDCPKPMCEEYSVSGDEYCSRIKDHDLPHRDDHSGIEFTETETDLIERDAMSDPTPETDSEFEIEALLQASITDKLPADATKDDIAEAVAAAAAILRGAGYRRIIPTTFEGHNEF